MTANVYGSAATVDWLNVRAYGATGGGTADDTAAIQSAMTAAATAGGGVVYFPAGTYRLTSGLTGSTQVTLIGDGAGETILRQTSTSANVITYTTSSGALSSVTVAGLQLQGPGSGTGVGLAMSAASGTAQVLSCAVRDVLVVSMGSHGIYIQTPVATTLENVQVRTGSGHGFYLTGGTSVTLETCYASSNHQVGFYLSSMAYSALSGCGAVSCGAGYLVSGGSNVSLSGCGAELIAAGSGQDGTSFKVSGGVGHTLASCYSNQNSAVGFWITGSATGVTLASPYEYNPTGAATASIKTDSSTAAVVSAYNYTTAPAYTTGTVVLVKATATSYFPAIEAATAQVDSTLTVNGALTGTTEALSTGAAAGKILAVTNTTGSPTVDNVLITSATAGDATLGVRVAGDTADRYTVDSTGKIQWGPGGSTAPDTTLYRSAASTLRTNTALDVGGTIIPLRSSWAEDATNRTTTSTTYAAASAGLSITIVVPPSGKVLVRMCVRCDNSSSVNTLSDFNVSGSVSGSLYAAGDANAAQWNGSTSVGPLAKEEMITSSNIGETLTITAQHRVNSASTGNLRYRTLSALAMGA